MNQQQMYVVTYESGETQEEYGMNEADVREFIQRSFSHMGTIKDISPLQGEDGSEA